MIKILIILLLMTEIGYTQNAQVSPVAGLNQQNTSVVNNNFQQVQTGVNGLYGFFGKYFTGGALNTANGGTGKDFSAVTADSLIYFSAKGTMTTLLPGNAGTVVMSNGSGIPPSFSWVTNTRIFTSSSTFTVPTGITKVYLTMIGGGGGGGNDDGGGGGSGAYVLNVPYTVTPAANLTVTVGAGGNGGADPGVNNGATGGTTTFDALSVLGGSGGTQGSGNGGAGGVGGFTSGIVSATTEVGGGRTFSGSNGTKHNGDIGGGGGGSPFGSGATGIIASAGTNATANTGAGGSGAASTTGVRPGGNGGSGFVMVQY